MDYIKLSDFEINKLVARALDGLSGDENTACDCYLKSMRGDSSVRVVDDDIGYHHFDYCNKPSDAWPIIEGNLMCISPSGVDKNGFRLWAAFCGLKGAKSTKPLRAAMMAFLMMKEKENARDN